MMVLGIERSQPDSEMNYPERMARGMLFEFVCGEPGAWLRDQ